MSKLQFEEINNGNNSGNNDVLQAMKIYQIYKTGKSEVVALKGLNLELKSKEFLAIIGPSGSGKSSLLNVLGGIMRPSAGVVVYNGLDITKLTEQDLVEFRRHTIGFVFQEGNLVPTQSAFENVENTLRFLGKSRTERKKRAKEILHDVGLSDRINHIPSKLSGGERQRVAIARALAGNPSVILADEPTGNLDDETSVVILDLFKELNKNTGISFLIVTHDKLTTSYATRSLELHDGLLIGQHDTSNLDLSKIDSSRLLRIDEEGRIPVNSALLDDLYSKIKQPVVLWKSRIQNLPLEEKQENSPILPSLVLSPIVAEGMKPKIKQADNIVCQICNAILPPTAMFCTECGAKFV